jgi:hypothetical protein
MIAPSPVASFVPGYLDCTTMYSTAALISAAKSQAWPRRGEDGGAERGGRDLRFHDLRRG